MRKHEIEITEISLASVTDQYLEYLSLLEQLDIGAAGEFLGVASLLIEMKSQQVLPRADEVQDALEDPRQDLVRRLLEYKEYRDAASVLEERGRAWQQHYPRLSTDLPGQSRDPADEPIQEVELWDLVSAFGRIMRESEAARPSNIVYDDTPIHVYMSRIHVRLLEAGRLALRDLFDPSMHKSQLVGVFLAILELVRHHHVRVEQDRLFGEIWIVPNLECTAPLDLSDVDEYEHAEKGLGIRD